MFARESESVTFLYSHQDEIPCHYAHVDSSDTTVRLSPSTSHTLLKPIGSGTGQHLVDSDDVEGVGPDPQVERVLSGSLDDVLVAANTGSLQSLGGDLLVLVRDQVGAEGEVIDGSPLSAQVEDSDLGVGYYKWPRNQRSHPG